MKKIILTTTALVLLGALGFATCFVMKMKSDYDQLLAASSGAIGVKVESDRLKELREEVKSGAWRVHGQGINGFEDLLAELGMKKGIDGLTEFYGYELHPFDWGDLERNKRTVVVAVTRSGIMPEPQDGLFHVTKKGDFGVIFIEDDLVEFHHETEEGLLGGILTTRTNESNQSEQATAFAAPVF
jgi:hypothetical protein